MKRVQFGGGPTSTVSGFTGRPREILVDTTESTLTVHDGVTPGGRRMLSTNGDGSAVTVSGRTLSEALAGLYDGDGLHMSGRVRHAYPAPTYDLYSATFSAWSLKDFSAAPAVPAGKALAAYHVQGTAGATGSLRAYSFYLSSDATATDGQAVRGMTGVIHGVGSNKLTAIRTTVEQEAGATGIIVGQVSEVRPVNTTSDCWAHNAVVSAGATGEGNDKATAYVIASDGPRLLNGIAFLDSCEFSDTVLQARMTSASSASSYFLKLKSATTNAFEVRRDGEVRSAQHLQAGASAAEGVRVTPTGVARQESSGNLTVGAGSSGTLFLDGGQMNVRTGGAVRIATDGSGRSLFATAGQAAATLADNFAPIQVDSDSSLARGISFNKGGSYGLWMGYDRGSSVVTGSVGMIRQVATDPLVVVVNNNSECLRFASDRSITHRGNATVIVDANSHLGLRSYTVATLPSAGTAARLIGVSDGAGNKRLAISDGVNWRWPDGAVVS